MEKLHLIIIGHNQIPGTGKHASNFDVLKFYRNIGIDEKNIGFIV
jgi:hypothetical protein